MYKTGVDNLIIACEDKALNNATKINTNSSKSLYHLLFLLLSSAIKIIIIFINAVL